MAIPNAQDGQVPPADRPPAWPEERPAWPEGPPATVQPAARGGLPTGAPVPPQVPARAAWWGLGGIAVAYVLGGIGVSIGQAVTGTKSTSTLDLFSEPGLWAGMLLTAVFVSYRYGSKSLARDFGLRAKLADIPFGLSVFVAMYILASIVVAVFEGTKYSGSNVAVLSGQKGNSGGYIVVSAMVAIGAPFFEELFFRGFLRTTLQGWLGPNGAIFGQAVFFGLAHYGEVKGDANVSVVLAMFALGVVLGYAARFTGRLAPGMVAHCLFNLVAVISLA